MKQVLLNGHIEKPVNKLSEWLKQNHTPEEIRERLVQDKGMFDAADDDDITDQDMDRFDHPNQMVRIFQTDKLNELKASSKKIRKELGYDSE